MTRYLLYRLLSAIPILAVVSLASFLLIFLVPGDPAAEIAGPGATSEDQSEGGRAPLRFLPPGVARPQAALGALRPEACGPSRPPLHSARSSAPAAQVITAP